jgi:hypothetical protein
MRFLFFLFLYFLPYEALVLRHGEGNNYHNIVWYHFPKTGGTTMRSYLFKFCNENSYNLTTSYGIMNECETIPYSCHHGNKLYFIYGHDREPFIAPTSPKVKRLKIMMLRDPLSWLTSRIQHEMRKNKNLNKPMSFLNAIIQFGPKYFNFLDDSARQSAMKIFHRLVKASSSSSSSLQISPLPIDSSYSLLLSQVESLFQQEIFVLQNSYYSESLEMLSKIFNSSFLMVSNDSNPTPPSQLRLNEAFESQESYSMGTLSDIKKLNILLELHNQIYHLSLKEFIRQRDQIL